MPTSGWRCERKGISEVLELGNRIIAHPPKAQNGRCPRSQPCLVERTWHWSGPPCSAGPGGLHVFGPTVGQEEVVPLLLWACLCFSMSLLSEDRSSSSFFPSASPQFWRKQADYSCKKRKSEQGGGRCHRQTPLKATGCSFTFTLLKNVN